MPMKRSDWNICSLQGDRIKKINAQHRREFFKQRKGYSTILGVTVSSHSLIEHSRCSIVLLHFVLLLVKFNYFWLYGEFTLIDWTFIMLNSSYNFHSALGLSSNLVNDMAFKFQEVVWSCWCSLEWFQHTKCDLMSRLVGGWGLWSWIWMYFCKKILVPIAMGMQVYFHVFFFVNIYSH